MQVVMNVDSQAETGQQMGSQLKVLMLLHRCPMLPVDFVGIKSVATGLVGFAALGVTNKLCRDEDRIFWIPSWYYQPT